MAELRFYGFHYLRVAVAEGANADATDEVEPCFAGAVVKPAPFGPFDFEQERHIVGLSYMAEKELAESGHERWVCGVAVGGGTMPPCHRKYVKV